MTGRRARRLVGVDAARGLALLGMMSIHVLPRFDDDGGTSTAYLLSSGRASALFAVLAGVGLALARSTRAGVLARGLVVAAVGLTLGGLETPVAVILVHYGVLFAVATAFLPLRPRTLALLGAAWLAASPLVAFWLRGHLPPGPAPNPSWAGLDDPVGLLTDVVLTGYYPVAQWTGYLLVGLAVGRTPLHRTGVAAAVAAAGAVVAGTAKILSFVLLGPLGGAARLDDVPAFYGTTPVDTWWWLAVSAPHSGTPLDLLHTTGTALVVLGACLLVAARWPAPLLPLAAAGSMTLTLYTAHVLALGPLAGPTRSWEPGDVLLLHAVAALVAASVWRATGRRGPLEAVAAGATRAAGRVAVSRRG
jgi:hypothetical protein